MIAALIAVLAVAVVLTAAAFLDERADRRPKHAARPFSRPRSTARVHVPRHQFARGA